MNMLHGTRLLRGTGLFVKLAIIFAVCIAHLLYSAFIAAAAPSETLSEADSQEREVFRVLSSGQRVTEQRSYSAPAEPTVYLTFDDGPSSNTPEVLDILKREQVPATFFVLGGAAEARPQLMKRIANEGHAIGNHTYDHVYKNLYESFEGFWSQVTQTERVIEQTAETSSRLLRAPGGTTNFDAAYFYYLEKAGYAVFDWNVDSGDSLRKNVPAKEIIENATNVTLRNELIVLLHDGPGHAETVKALPDIIRFYKEKGYTFKPLSTEVKPIQFKLGPAKWGRSISQSQHAKWTALAAAHAAGWSDQAAKPIDPADPVSGAEPGMAAPAEEPSPKKVPAAVMAATSVPPLTIKLGTGEMQLGSPAYSFRSDRFYVPLRELGESMGARVEWEADTRKAIVTYGVYRVEYDLPNRSISAVAPGKQKKHIVFADISLADGKLVVPLRSAVELLGGEISSYTIQADLREVHVHQRDGYGLALAPDWSRLHLGSSNLLAYGMKI